MDAVTHIVVGAAIGEVALGTELGGKAMLYGIAAGWLPDVDTLLGPFEDDVTFLTSHRGITHSLLFAVIVGLLLGWAMVKLHPAAGVTFKDGATLFLAGLLAHVLLDACTTYGTPLLLPFSDRRVAFNNLFIVDPFFTLPLVACVLTGLFFDSHGNRRQAICVVGLVLCCLYLGWTCLNKYQVHHAFSNSLAQQDIQPTRFMTAPAPFSNVLWYCLAEDDEGYWIGYYSLLDRARPIHYTFVSRHGEWIADIKDTPLLRRLIWFSDGYYALRQQDGQVVFDVLKFGLVPLDADGPQTAFSFALDRNDRGNVTAHGFGRRKIDLGRLAAWVWQQVWGDRRQ